MRHCLGKKERERRERGKERKEKKIKKGKGKEKHNRGRSPGEERRGGSRLPSSSCCSPMTLMTLVPFPACTRRLKNLHSSQDTDGSCNLKEDRVYTWCTHAHIDSYTTHKRNQIFTITHEDNAKLKHVTTQLLK